VSGWYNPDAWSTPSRSVSDIQEPKVSRLLGPDGQPIPYKPQQQPIGFYKLGERVKKNG
jgi:hypothetical protein